MISLLVVVIVMGLVVYLLGIIPIAEPFRTIALVICVVIAIVYLLGFIGVGPGLGRLR